MLAEAAQWTDFGWDDRDDFDDAVLWWKNWFSPEEAWIFWREMADYDNIRTGKRFSNGLPIHVAIELRNRGIDALDVRDAAKHAPDAFNVHSADDVARAVEESRAWLKANKRGRTSRRRGR